MEFIKIIDKNEIQVDAVYSILKSSGKYMCDTFGLMHWLKPYSKDKIKEDIDNKDVYLVVDNEQSIATFMLSENTSYYFEEIPVDNAIYLSKLAVIPDFMHSGIGTACMNYIEELCKKNYKTRVRLDVYDKSTQAVNFYMKMGYKKLFLKDTTNFKVICMEKEIKN